MHFELIFDVETQKLFSDIESEDPADLGLSVVSVYGRKVDEEGEEVGGKMMSFWHPDAGMTPTVDAMWELFEKADRIIGFNSKKFDSRVLRPHYHKDIENFPHFDILEIVKENLGKRLPLDLLAGSTLGVNKTDRGTNAVYYWANKTAGNLEKLQTYCESDVMITRDLYDFGRKHKYLKYIDRWNRVVEIPVDFSYPPPKQTENQIGLF